MSSILFIDNLYFFRYCRHKPPISTLSAPRSIIFLMIIRASVSTVILEKAIKEGRLLVDYQVCCSVALPRTPVPSLSYSCHNACIAPPEALQSSCLCEWRQYIIDRHPSHYSNILFRLAQRQPPIPVPIQATRFSH